MASRNEIENEAMQAAKNHIENFIDPVTGEVQLTELGEWLAAEFKFEEGDETPFEIAFTVARERERRQAQALSARNNYRHLWY